MRLIVPALLGALIIGCTGSGTPTAANQQSAYAEGVEPAPVTKITGTVISFGSHPNTGYTYSVLRYLDDDGMLRVEILPGYGMAADLSPDKPFRVQQVHMSWIPREGDRLRMTRDTRGNYDIAKISHE
jgi:hypothetical protein